MNILLKLENVGIKPIGADNEILSQINYQLEQCDFVIVLGSNGSGKSTLIKAINKTYPLNSGKIFIAERDLKTINNKEMTQTIITLTQNVHESLFSSLTVLENCLMTKQRKEQHYFRFSTKSERAFFAKYLRDFNLNLPDKLDLVVENLSGGEKQSLALALSVLYPPQLLLLDEHTSALDPKSAERIMTLTNKVVREHGITCFLTTHNLDLALNYGNKILALKDGKILHTIDRHEQDPLTATDLLKFYH